MLKLSSSCFVTNRYQRAPSGLLASGTVSTQSINLKIVELGPVTPSNCRITENSLEVAIASVASTTGEMKPVRME